MIETLHPATTTETSGWMRSGYRHAAVVAEESTLSVGIIARNAEHTIGRTLDVVDSVASHFREATCYVLTNDNTDDTEGALAGWSGKSVSLGWSSKNLGRPHLGGTRERARTEALAEYRNEVRAALPRSDYVLILDADLLEVMPSRLMAGLGDMLRMCWHAVAAQNLVLLKALEPNWLINYDAFAFRPYWGDTTNYMVERCFHYDVRPSGTRPYRVLSAFGGACWYRGPEYFSESRSYDGSQGCEHVPFHRDLVMGVSPSMSLIGFLQS